jgi:hypothetical protein
MKKFQTITAICAAVSGFMFGCLSLNFMIERHDPMLLPFAIIGFLGSVVMWANRK